MRRITASGLLALAATLALAAGSAAAVAAPGTPGNPAAASPQHPLLSISCVSAKSCMAVGENAAAANHNGAVLAETWNGTRWRQTTIKAPPGSEGSRLTGVSCLSARSCIAVGSYFYSLPDESIRNVPISEAWNGSTWRLTKMPQPAGSSAFAAAVSCVSAVRCVAVGELTTTTKQTAFAEVWNGTRWRLTKVSEPARSLSYFGSVSCTAATRCIAVDLYNPRQLAESWNGTRWAVMKEPFAPASGPSLASVYCLKASFCVATGSHYPNPKNFAALAETWNGRTWRPSAVPAPGAGWADLTGVSCVSTKNCLAVGRYNFGVYENSGKAYAAGWNGRRWRLIRVPTPPGGKATGSGSALYSVKCVSASDCIAVGEAGAEGGPGNGFSAIWNGRRWRFVAIA